MLKILYYQYLWVWFETIIFTRNTLWRVAWNHGEIKVLLDLNNLKLTTSVPLQRQVFHTRQDICYQYTTTLTIQLKFTSTNVPVPQWYWFQKAHYLWTVKYKSCCLLCVSILTCICTFGLLCCVCVCFLPPPVNVASLCRYLTLSTMSHETNKLNLNWRKSWVPPQPHPEESPLRT